MMLGAVISELGAVIRSLKVGLSISSDNHRKVRGHFERAEDGFTLSARCNRRCL